MSFPAFAAKGLKAERFALLDIGCSGGGFVRDLLDDGHIAIGLEGSDYSKKSRRAEWAIIPDFLFTADVTGDVDIFMNGRGDPLRLRAADRV